MIGRVEARRRWYPGPPINSYDLFGLFWEGHDPHADDFGFEWPTWIWNIIGDSEDEWQ